MFNRKLPFWDIFSKDKDKASAAFVWWYIHRFSTDRVRLTLAGWQEVKILLRKSRDTTKSRSRIETHSHFSVDHVTQRRVCAMSSCLSLRRVWVKNDVSWHDTDLWPTCCQLIQSLRPSHSHRKLKSVLTAHTISLGSANVANACLSTLLSRNRFP